jgi:hypothetical protein
LRDVICTHELPNPDLTCYAATLWGVTAALYLTRDAASPIGWLECPTDAPRPLQIALGRMITCHHVSLKESADDHGSQPPVAPSFFRAPTILSSRATSDIAAAAAQFSYFVTRIKSESLRIFANGRADRVCRQGALAQHPSPGN